MSRQYLILFALFLVVFLAGSSSAGSNGDSPQEGQDWIITQDTHVWNEDVSVKDIILVPGKTLQLDDVNLISQGEINLEGDSVWTNSTVYHEQVEVTDNISIYKKLEIINTNLTIKASKEYTDTNANKIYLHEGSLLIIRDYDRDPTTINDISIVKADNSHIDNLTLKVNYTVDIGSLVKRVGEDYGPNSIVNTNIQIENSHLEYINAIRLYGDNSKIHNTTFEKCNVLNIVSNNFTFLSNTFRNSTIEDWLGYIGGNDTTIANNILKDVPAGFVSWDSERILLDNNTCDGLIGSCFRLIGVNNSIISNNIFQNITDWSTLFMTNSDNNTITDNFFYNSTPNGDVFFLSGDNNLIDNNYFHGCGSNGEWWQECLQISQDDNREAYGNRVTNNKFLNVSGSGLALTSNVNNTFVGNNLFEGRGDTRTSDFGILIVMYNGNNNDPYLFAPSDTTIVNNTISNFSYGIGGDYWNYGNWGHNNLFESNYIENTNAGIFIWSLYDDTIIKDNTIHSTHYNNDTAVGWAGIYIKSESSYWARNTTVSNNTIHSERGPGILSDNNQNITITKNIVTVVVPKQWLGNGIMVRESIEVNVTHNKISTNLSSLSTDAGIFIYGGSDILISNNDIEGAIGIEASNVGFSSGTMTDIANNTIRASNYGVISNRTDSNIVNNTIVGLCADSSCKLLNFDKVSRYGIFTQESVLNTEKNNITYFYESFAGFLSEFNITDTYIAHTQIGVKGNNSEIELYNSTITNSFYSSVFLYKSDYESIANNFTNFDKGIYSLNSTLSVNNDDFTDGDICLDLIDSEYNFGSNLFDCRINNLIVRYNVQVKIADESDQGFEDYQFEIYNSKNDRVVNKFTGSSGYSNYYLLDIYKLNSEGLEINYNPFSLIYLNNKVEVTLTKNINYNQTLLGLLDTTPPVSELSGNSSLSSEEKIFLNLSLVGEFDDFSNYTIEYLVNEEFAEWTSYGIYTNSVVEFIGEDGKEYRFRVISRDIYGNVELKEDFEHQVEIDTSTPETFFNSFSEDYYFTGTKNLDLSWYSDDDDVSNQTLQIFFTNFTDPYLNPNSVNWFISEEIIFEDQDSYVYEFTEEGHYGFKILSTDLAGNLEDKTKFDVVFNYDSNSDTLIFGEIPERWGSSEMNLAYETSSFNLDFDLFISLETMGTDSDYLTWYLYDYESDNNEIILKGLQDNTRYYIYAMSTDLAGNVENPLNTTEHFSSDGLYDQQFELKYVPLFGWGYDFIVDIDNDFDGLFETTLIRGYDQTSLQSNEFYFSQENNLIMFGGLATGGFVPNEDLENTNNIRISYSGVQGIFEVYTGKPESANSININPTNTTELVISFVVPKDVPICKVQRSTNISKENGGYFNEKIVSPCPAGLIEYIHTNPELDEQYYYQILIVDEFGHESISENRSIDMKDVVKLYSTNDDSETGILGMDSIIPLTAVVGIVMLAFGGVLLYQSKKNDALDENVSVIESKPVAKYKVEELYLIYQDGRLIKNISDVEVKTDSEIMSGMLTAINDFVQDSFNTEGDIGSIDYGNNKIVLQRGNNSYLAAVIYGEVDKFFKGKMINAVRSIEGVNTTMPTWNGDAETIYHVEHYLQPIIDETNQATREMVDNYFSEKEIVMTTKYEKVGDIIDLQIHLSNYSAAGIKNCTLTPVINSSHLGLIGIEPDISYSFADNSFVVGDVESYNEVTFSLKLQMKVTGSTPLEIKLNYQQKGREGVTSSLLEIV